MSSSTAQDFEAVQKTHVSCFIGCCFIRKRENQGKVQLGNLKSGRGRLQERSLTRAFHHKV